MDELVVGQFRAHTLTFWDFCIYGDPEFGKKDPIANMFHMVDIKSDFLISFFHEGSKTKFFACLLRDETRDWWEEVGPTLGDEIIEAMI